jgi:hypothetical protein
VRTSSRARRVGMVLVAIASTLAVALPASAAPPQIGYSAEGRQPLQSDLFFANLDGSGRFEVTATASSEEADVDMPGAFSTEVGQAAVVSV